MVKNELSEAYKVGPAQWRPGLYLQGQICAVFVFSGFGLSLALVGVNVEEGL